MFLFSVFSQKKEREREREREKRREEKERKNSRLSRPSLSFLSTTKKHAKKQFNRFPDYEKVAFLNAALAQLWPYICLAAAEAARDLINPLLEEQRPPWLTKIAIARFELGPRPPTVEGVKVFPASPRGGSPPGAAVKDADADAAAAAAAAALDGSGAGGQRGPPSHQSDAVVVEVEVDWTGSQGELFEFFFLSLLLLLFSFAPSSSLLFRAFFFSSLSRLLVLFSFAPSSSRVLALLSRDNGQKKSLSPPPFSAS